MSKQVRRLCDSGTDGPPHEARGVARVHIGDVAYAMDVCDEHAGALAETLRGLGFVPDSIAVGHNRRAAYLTRSGRPFSTREVRDWLRSQGAHVSDAGRLPDDVLRAYAHCH